jgi:leader peptidase (prepilin peptidase) / N-methyltransferase
VVSVYLFAFDGFLLGLFFGSFLNVCISRLPAHESIVRPRSHCAACGHTVRWYDNIPVLSWLLLRARCRDCKARIPWRYPAVEAAMGVWVALCTYKMCGLLSLYNSCASIPVPPGLHTPRPDLMGPFTAAGVFSLVGLAIFGFLSIGLIVTDWQTHRLPDSFTLPGIGVGFFLACVQAIFLAPGEGDVVLSADHQLRLSSPGSSTAQGNVFLTGSEAMVFGRIAAVCGAALILLAVRWTYKRLRGREGMGLGDVKLLAMIAAFLGFTQSLLALFAGVLAAALYGLTLLALRRATPSSKLPFGSFLAAGGLFAALFGPTIVTWYANLLR